MTTRLLLVRHGQTAYNAEVRFMGQLDVPLDETGRAQAEAVAQRLADEHPAAIYSSNLGRALDTAQAIQAAINPRPELHVDARLIEGHFGDWQGKTYEELKVHDAARLAEWETARLKVRPPNGESVPDLAKRVQPAYQDILRAHPDQDVIVVAHGGTLQVMLVLALELPLEDYRKLWLSNASVSELHLEAGRAILFRLNDTNHLAGIARHDPTHMA